MIYCILVLFLVGIDQMSKFWVVDNLALHDSMPFLPHLVELYYIQNTGAAFSMLNEHTWFLTGISLFLSIFLIYLIKTDFFPSFWGKISLSVILAGAIGNLIDRAFRGFVVDMFHFLFVRFAIFNFADICVVLGGIAAGIYYIFCMEHEESSPNKENNLDKSTEIQGTDLQQQEEDHHE